MIAVRNGAATVQRMSTTPASLYALVGGDQWFVDLVERFYAGVETDPTLRSLYPDDLTGAKAHLAGFLVQYWGGPSTYSDERGHPRLRMRHVAFAIGVEQRDAWVRHMVRAVRLSGLDPEVENQVIDYFEMAATHLINHRRDAAI
jgi:hemoglobin